MTLSIDIPDHLWELAQKNVLIMNRGRADDEQWGVEELFKCLTIYLGDLPEEDDFKVVKETMDSAIKRLEDWYE